MRVHTPTVASEGWDAPHTLIDIVNDDMPFLVDSVTMAIDRHDLGVHLVVHPVLDVRARGRRRRSSALDPPTAPATTRESWVHVEIDRETSPEILDAVRADLERVLGDVRAATGDWLKMLAALDTVDDELDEHPPPVDPDELAEGRALLRWMADQHFTFLGYRAYDLERDADGGDVLRAVPGSGLGILRDRAGGPTGTRRRASRKLPARDPRQGARDEPARAHEGERALDRAPPDVPRLRRRQALRRARQRDRRAPLPRALHVVGVHRQPDRRPGAAAQGRRR